MKGLALQTPPTYCTTFQLAFPHARETSHKCLSAQSYLLQAHLTDFVLKLVFMSLTQVEEAPLAISKFACISCWWTFRITLCTGFNTYSSFQHVHSESYSASGALCPLSAPKKALCTRQQHSCNRACKVNTKKAALAQHHRDGAHQHRAA